MKALKKKSISILPKMVGIKLIVISQIPGKDFYEFKLPNDKTDNGNDLFIF